ncbi:PREDICTED: uncharacterized protein LOC101315224 [Fragaria vesca subsp. vesca]
MSSPRGLIPSVTIATTPSAIIPIFDKREQQNQQRLCGMNIGLKPKDQKGKESPTKSKAKATKAPPPFQAKLYSKEIIRRYEDSRTGIHRQGYHTHPNLLSNYSGSK